MFDAARDLVFTNSADGNSITSGGYRISKLFGGGVKRKQKGGKKKTKKEDEIYNEEMENFYKEESGIPIGLLFVGPNFRVERERAANMDKNPCNDRNGELELELIMPSSQNPQSHLSQSSSQFIMVCDDNNCELKEDSREINSQEVDADLFQILLENALTDHGHDRSNENAASSKKLTRKQRTNIAKIINNNVNDVNLKNLKVDKIYMRRKTRRHNNN